MNLLALLLKVFMAKDTLNSISEKTGISKNLIRMLVPLAIPLLIRYMTKNASSQSGAESLFHALGQHTSKRTLREQIDEADAEDGEKIIHHILGKDNDKVVRELASRSGMNISQVMKLLSLFAPIILSVLSSASNSAHQQQVQVPTQAASSMDLSSLASMFLGNAQEPQTQPQQAQPSMSGIGLLSTLLGMGSQQNQQTQQAYQQPVYQQPVYNHQSQQQQPTYVNGPTNYLGKPGSQQAQSSTSGNNGLTSLFGSMLGMGAQSAPQESSLDGSDLLALLSALYK